MLEISQLNEYHHLLTNNVPVVCSLTYMEFNQLNKSLNVELNDFDDYYRSSDYFVLTWAQNREPVHFILYSNALIIVNGHEDVFLHLKTQQPGSPEQLFRMCMKYLLDELEQMSSSIELDVLTIQDLTNNEADSKFKDLLLRIRNTRILILRLKFSIHMKKCLIQRCEIPMYNNLTDLLVLEDKINQDLQILDVMYKHYLGSLSLKTAVDSNELNLVMRKLTIATIFGIPLTIISSAWGYNVQVPGYASYDGFYYVFFLAFFLSTVIAYASHKFV